MTPYKDPKMQRAAQAAWVTQCRRDWLAAQRCLGCGAREGLRVFREPGTPKLGWSKRGPSHDSFVVVCADQAACLVRRAPKEVVKKKVVKKKARSRTAPVGKVVVVELEGEREPSRLAAEMAKPDRRAVCEVHGPRGRVRIKGEWRFVCCARVVPG